jgi:hypothetical protein
MDKIKKRESLNKNMSTSDSFLDFILGLPLQIANIVEYTIQTLLDTKDNKNKNASSLDYIETAMGLVSRKQELKHSTKSKENALILKTQLVIVSESKDEVRKHNLIESTAQNYNSIREDNELTYSRIKSKHADKFNPLNYDFKGATTNYMSINECGNFIQTAGKKLLNTHRNIESIKVLEEKPSQELLNGYIRLGTCKVKENTTNVYMSAEGNLANLGLVILGQQGSGKSQYIANYIYDAWEKKECVVLIDIIKNCELSDLIESVIPSKDILKIDLSTLEGMQGFCYNEVFNFNNDDPFSRLETSNMCSQLTMSFIDSINKEGNPLSGRMRKYLSSAGNVVYLQKQTSLRDVIKCLDNHVARHKFIELIPKELKQLLEDDIQNLEELDEYDKKGETIIGTKDSKIEFIMDRVGLLKEDIKLKSMFNKSSETNIDFVKAMNEGKIILIKIPEHRYPTKFHKNILTTFYVSKVWVSSQLRGNMFETPLRSHTIIDEIFQAPTAEKMLVDILPQGRKFQDKFVFSAHYLSQIETIREALKASGASYMLLQGTDKKNYDEMKADLLPYTYDDLRNLKQWHSLNMIKTKEGYAKFITHLPDLLKPNI